MPEESPSDATTAGPAARSRAAGAVVLVMCALLIVASVVRIAGSGGSGASPGAIVSASPDAPLAILTPLAPDRLATATAPAPPVTPTARKPAPPLARDAVEPIPGRPGDAIRDIPVRVEAGDGRPFAGALATFSARSGRIPDPVTRTARLDGTGEVDLPFALAPGGPGLISIGLLSIEGGPPGLAEAHARSVEPVIVDTALDENVPIVFRLPGLRPTRFLVLGPDGAPSRGARLVLGWEEDEAENGRLREAVTDALGIAGVPGLLPGHVHAHAVSRDGRSATRTALVVDPAREPLALRLEGPGALVVTAVDDRGAPVLVPLGLAVAPETFLGPPVAATVLPGGVLEARLSLAPGVWSLEPGEGGYEAFPGFEKRHLEVLPGEVLRVVVTAPPTGRLEGLVRFDGRPVEGARVRIGEESAVARGGGAEAGPTDREGRFLATVAGELLVAVHVTGTARAERRVHVTPGETVALSIDLSRPARLTVVAATPSGVSAPAWELGVYHLAGGAPALSGGVALTAPGIEFAGYQFTDLAPGRYLATIQTATAVTSLEPGDDKVLVVIVPEALEEPVPPTGAAVVRLVDPLLDDQDRPQELVLRAFARGTAMTIGDALFEGGEARLTLPAGPATLQITPNGRRRLLTRPFDVTIVAGREVEALVPRPALGTLEVRLQGLPPEDHGPASPWELIVDPLVDGAGRQADGAGEEDLEGDHVRFRLPAPAAYRIRLHYNGRRERSATATLEAGATTAVTIALPEERRTAVLRFDGDLPVRVEVRDPLAHRYSPWLHFEPMRASDQPGEERIAGIRLEPGAAKLVLYFEGDEDLAPRFVDALDVPDGADLRIRVPRLGKGRIAAFVPAPEPGPSTLCDVRLVGPAGPLAPSWRGRVAWDRLPAGTYRLEVGGALAREVTLEEGATVELGLVGAP